MSVGEQAAALHAEGKSYREIGDALGLSKDAVFRLCKKIAAGTPARDASAPALTQTATDDEHATVESAPSARITTLEQLLDVAKVDRSVWDVERHVVNKWEVGTKGPDGKVVTTPLIQVKVWLVKIAGVETVKQIWNAFLDDVTNRPQAPYVKPRVRWVPPSERHMGEFCIFDAHIGKYGWSEEVGENFDTGIAVERVRTAIDDLYHQSSIYPLESILLPWGNDLQHYDTLTGLTTAGTPQDRDSRFAKMFRSACEVSVHAIDAAATIAPTHVLIMPGNHDRTATWSLGEYLAAWYRNDPRVTVDNRPTPRKYHDYGNTLLGFCHGDEEPLERLPVIMPVEVPTLWAASRYREWHVGHTHTSKRRDAMPVTGTNGVRVRTIQSLSGPDAWHNRKGYIGEPGCAEGFVWSYDRGLRANLFSNRQLERAA